MFVVFGQFLLKPLLSDFTHAHNVLDKLSGEYLCNKYFKKSATQNMFFGNFVEKASKLENFSPTFWSFNPFPSLPSVATNDKKQNKRHDKVLNNKPSPLFWEFSWEQDIFCILKNAKLVPLRVVFFVRSRVFQSINIQLTLSSIMQFYIWFWIV